MLNKRKTLFFFHRVLTEMKINSEVETKKNSNFMQIFLDLSFC